MTQLICTEVNRLDGTVTFREMHHPVTRGPVDYNFPVGETRDFMPGLVLEFGDTVEEGVHEVRRMLATVFRDVTERPAHVQPFEETGQIIDL